MNEKIITIIKCETCGAVNAHIEGEPYVCYKCGDTKNLFNIAEGKREIHMDKHKKNDRVVSVPLNNYLFFQCNICSTIFCTTSYGGGYNSSCPCCGSACSAGGGCGSSWSTTCPSGSGTGGDGLEIRPTDPPRRI